MCQLDILIFFFFSLYEHLHFRWTFAVPLKKHSKMAFTGAQNLGSEHWTLKLLLYRLWSFLPSGLPWDWRDRVWGVHLHHEETLAFCFTLQNIFPSLGIKCDILIGLIWKYGKFSWWILHSPQQICKKWQIWPNLYRVLCYSNHFLLILPKKTIEMQVWKFWWSILEEAEEEGVLPRRDGQPLFDNEQGNIELLSQWRLGDWVSQ